MKESKRWMLGLFLVFVITAALAHAAPVPDTGQTTCYDAGGNVITCPSPGQPFYGQDANYTINSPSYTKLDENGNALPDTATSWVMVRDNVTGLIWEVKQDNDGFQNYDNPHDADNTYTWYDPDPISNGGSAGTPGEGTDTGDFIDMLNNESFGSYSNWRIPSVKELTSIWNCGKWKPSINTAHFPNTMSTDGGRYWSATTNAHYPNVVFVSYFEFTSIGYESKSNAHCVRAVRDGK